MTENRSDLDWFHHFHQLAITELKILVRQDIPIPTDEAQKALVEKHQVLLESILESLSEEKPDPAAIFKKGLAALSNIDKERFLIENLLERVKQGYSLRDTLETYRELGLTDIDVSKIDREGSSPASPTDLPESSKGAGGILQGLLKRLKQVASNIGRLLINAMKVIPKFLGIKPSIGVSGPFPTFSLQFDLQIEPLTLYELFQDLTKGLGD